MKMYFKYLSLQIKSSFEYRVSLVFNMISSALSTVAFFFGIVCLFESFDHIGPYHLNEILITYSVITFSFSTAECFFRGFDMFDKLVRTGELDRLLIRPQSIFLQVLGSNVEFSKCGRMIFSFSILIYAVLSSSIVWTAMRVVTLVLMIVGSIIIFAGMFLIYSGVAIFTIEGLEAVNIITDGGRDLCSYPLDVYANYLRKLFTYVIPMAFVNYLPLKFLLGTCGNNLLYAFLPLISIVFFALCYLFFRWALTKYKSTGS